MSTGAVFDLSKRAKLRVSGADRLRFLNGQVTNDVRKAGVDQAIEASILNAKGKMNAQVFIATDWNSYVLDAEEELLEDLIARLEKYVIADDVQIEDVTEKFSIFHVVAPQSPQIENAERTVRADRFGSIGFDFWFNKKEAKAHPAFPVLDEQAAETFRIERGIPRWGRELSDEIIPVEANLEATSIDYEKGCYIGQETISRMKMSGQANKRLCGLVSISNAPLVSGMRLTSNISEGKNAGWITSAARSFLLEKEIALGYVKRGFNSVGARLHAISAEGGDAAAVPVEVVPLPFAL